MKKIALLLILAAGATQVKAQQIQLNNKPDIKLNDDLRNAFKPVTPLTPQQMLTQPTATVNNETVFYSTMPIIKISSVDHMPVRKLGTDGVNYTMLVKKEKVINPVAQPSILPLP